MRISEYLMIGKDNAIPAERIMQNFNISRRQLYKEIEHERLEGTPILPDWHGGYYLADTETESGRTEILAFHSRMSAAAASSFAVIRGMKQA